MPMRTEHLHICRKPKRGDMSAPRKLSAGPVRSDSMRSPEGSRKKTKIPKPVNVTHAECERALWAWKKRKRTDNLSNKQHQPKPVH